MRLELDGRAIRVALSERNLKTLLAKLQGHPPDSACTLTYPTKEGYILIVTAEPDALHYANPERDIPYPGPMHPDTERKIRSQS